MSTDSTDPTRDLGTTGDAGTSAPHPQSDRPAPGAPEAPGAQSMPKPDAGAVRWARTSSARRPR